MDWFQPIAEVVGAFDSFKLGEFREFILRRRDEGEEQASLELEVDAEYVGGYFVRLEFRGVRQLILRELTSPWFGFGESDILSLEGHWLEGLNYQVVSELGEIQFYCRDVRVLQITKLDPSGAEMVLWRHQDRDAPETGASSWP
jgi:hypothetical protein